MASRVVFVAFVVSANVMEVKVLNVFVIILVLSFCVKDFLWAVRKLLLGSFEVNFFGLLCIEEIKHVELFTHPKVVSCILTLHVFICVNLNNELNGSAVFKHVVLDHGSAVMFLTFNLQDCLVLLQMMEILLSATEQCLVIINAH